MDAWLWIVIAVVVVAAVAAIAFVATRGRKRQQLRQRFGPEYERTVGEVGDRRAAEGELAERAKRREQLDIRPLSAAARDRYAEQWRQVQTRFVDQPDSAVGEADALVSQVMRDRGYPIEDFEAQAGLISVDHPHVVENYRFAHRIYVRNTQNLASTDELRQALLHYRSLFDELLEDKDTARRAGD